MLIHRYILCSHMQDACVFKVEWKFPIMTVGKMTVKDEGSLPCVRPAFRAGSQWPSSEEQICLFLLPARWPLISGPKFWSNAGYSFHVITSKRVYVEFPAPACHVDLLREEGREGRTKDASLFLRPLFHNSFNPFTEKNAESQLNGFHARIGPK